MTKKVQDASTTALAGAISSTLVYIQQYPQENIRVRLQIEKKYKEKLDDSQIYSAIQYIRNILSNEGISGLYSGMNSGILGVIISSTIYFFFYNLLKNTYTNVTKKEQIPPSGNILIASMAGIINVLLTTPIWVLNTRIMLEDKENNNIEDNAPSLACGLINAAKKIFYNEGISGFYRGVVSALILVSNPVIQFVIYDQLTTFIKYGTNYHNKTYNIHTSDALIYKKKFAQQRQLSTIEIFFIAAFAKMIATIITYPYQVIKTRQHMDNISDTNNTANSQKSIAYISPSIKFLLMSIIKSEGFFGLFKGLPIKLIHTILSSAILFVTYENIVIFLYIIRKHKNISIIN